MVSDELEDMIVDYADARFELRPHPRYRDLLRISKFAARLGYEMPFSTKQYSLEDVQDILRAEGPSSFLRLVRVQEDISPKAPPQTVEQWMARRLARLAPTDDLLIIDPYLLPERPYPTAEEYGQRVADLIAPLLGEAARVTAVVNNRMNTTVESVVSAAIAVVRPNATITTIRSEDFHDRFWIADRSRGVILGSSLNKIGTKIFFMDGLSDADVKAIVQEAQAIGA